MPKQQVVSELAPRPRAGAPYSQAIAYGPFVFVSGQLPIDPTTGNLVEGGIDEQTTQVLENLRQVLLAAGSDLDLVLKTTVFLSDHDLWERMNDVYRTYLGDVPPARSAVPVTGLSLGALVEIEAIAHRSE